MEKKSIYPVSFEGKLWFENQVDETFKSFYHTRDALDWQNSVYVGDGLRIFPNGDFINGEIE